jgi:glycosyltransferase involved in cell wall biosynthesis
MAAGAVTASPVGRLAGRIASTVRRVLPQSAIRLSRSLPRRAVTSDEIRERLRQAGLAFGQIDLVVAPSAATAAEFAGLGFLSPAVDVSDYGFRLDPAADRRPATDGRLRIGYTGSIVWHKGLHVLLAAVRQLRGRYEVTIAGSLDVAPDYVRSLRRLAAGLPVSFAGPFARGEAPRIYAALDVLAVPSLWLENSPLVIHEAFAYGVAVVGSRLGGIPDLVIDGVNGFTCEAGSPAALAAVLQRFVDDPALAPARAARAPMVRTISDDASGWERRYGSRVGEPAGP